MKKFATKGEVIKRLRSQRAAGSFQKEMAHAVGLSTRTLRSIENANKPVSLNELDRIAGYLRVTREDIAYAIDGPKLVFPSQAFFDKVAADWSRDRLIPRFDDTYAHVTMDAAKLLSDAGSAHDIAVHVLTDLTKETAAYVEEVMHLLESQTWQSSQRWSPAARDEDTLKRRLRELLVLLRGNDVWTYQDSHYRTLPERDDLPPEDEEHHLESRLVLGFGPPGEYGEDSVNVPIDHGQPFILKATIIDIKQG